MATSYLDQLWPAPPAADTVTDTLTYQEATAVEPANAPPEPADMPAPDTWDDPAEPAEPARLALALKMAAAGLHILPLVPGDKVPLSKFKGWAEAGAPEDIKPSRDPEQIRRWFDLYPDINYACVPLADFVIVDVDVRKGGNETIAALPFKLPEDTFVVSTPSGGRHLYYRTTDAIRGGTDKLGKGGDVQAGHRYVVGPGCEFRDPGGKKGYSGSYTVTKDAVFLPSPEGLVLMCGTASARERDENRAPVAEQDRPEDIERAARFLAEAAPAVEGEGGDARTFRLACDLRDFGLTEGTALDMMAGWNARCLPPWLPDELAAKVTNAFSYGQNRPAAKSTAALADSFADAVTLDSTPAASPPSAAPDAPSLLIRRRIRAGEPRAAVRWRIKDVLPATGVGMIFGPPSAGKSTLVLDLAAHLTHGADWFGRRTRDRAGTLILACEGAGSLGTRLDALASDGEPMAIEAWDIGSLSAAGLASLRPELAKLDAEWRGRHGFGIGLVVLDTISASGMIDDENANAKVAAALKALADFAGSVGAFGLAVHHPRKDGETFRGAGAFEGNTDLIFEVRRGTVPATGELSIYKARDAAPGELGRFRLRQVTLGQDDDGEPITACTVEPRTAVPGGEPVADPEAMLADIIRRGPDGDGPHVAEEPGGCFRMDEGRSRDSIYRAIAEAYGIPFGTETGMLKLAPADRKAVRDHLRRLNARLVCSDDGRDRERRQVRVVLALHPRGATASDFGDATTI